MVLNCRQGRVHRINPNSHLPEADHPEQKEKASPRMEALPKPWLPHFANILLTKIEPPQFKEERETDHTS